MVNFFVWSILTVAPIYASSSDSRYVEVIIRDLEQSQFLKKIEDKVILFPNQLKKQLNYEPTSPLSDLKTSESEEKTSDTEKSQRVRRGSDKYESTRQQVSSPFLTNHL